MPTCRSGNGSTYRPGQSRRLWNENYGRSAGKFVVWMAKEAYDPPESKRNSEIPTNYASLGFRVVLNNHDSLEAVRARPS